MVVKCSATPHLTIDLGTTRGVKQLSSSIDLHRPRTGPKIPHWEKGGLSTRYRLLRDRNTHCAILAFGAFPTSVPKYLFEFESRSLRHLSPANTQDTIHIHASNVTEKLTRDQPLVQHLLIDFTNRESRSAISSMPHYTYICNLLTLISH